MNLAEHIAAHALDGITRRVSTVPYESETWQAACLCGWDGVEELAEHRARAAHAEHVAESWAEHRTVTTLDQLRELPDYVVVLDAGGNPWLRGAFGWRSSGLERGHSSISLPARILHIPEEDQ